MSPITNRYEFVLLFDVTNGNPNGDPDAGNLPRQDPETNLGLVTDVCLKRKVRNYVNLVHDGDPRFGIYVQDGAILNQKHRTAYKAVRPGNDAVTTAARLSPKDDDEEAAIRRFMCDNFFDVRTFGAVMSTGVNCGQVRGPVQLSFAQSLEPILPLEITLTRMAATTEKEAKDLAAVEDAAVGNDRRENRTMGRKYIVPYALYRVHGFISAKLAERTAPGNRPRKAEGSGFDDDDLEMLWTALEHMFDHDRSANRGEMASRRLILFRHDSALGNAPASTLFRRVTVKRHFEGASYDLTSADLHRLAPARRFEDYAISVDHTALPTGITILDRF
ncbi:type I-C CRISPR-associated protein Cas7/Csd2 [Azospirillum formosense]|uniref:Type I-C CRISPR-associated protein Cas7/Csd2 n=1 Tax=Azospirillum formosense TaxID=861533 RepID=A0ABX2KPQ7_9PROT|nr:type I-C CRISPR-associated protein Cas7/Csd2 [Azospirillum formosense]MBY3753872.1 type I-C CRISPR-associated protein Cas7/Csd2 [Azospirillum formosense]NUB18626.1 type I-C CRISPR-associated protein Cas7/Csd2 [Azospirillum formosense]